MKPTTVTKIKIRKREEWIKPAGTSVYLIRHRYEAEQALGKKLPKNACVHHVDGNRLNNNHSNLVICPSHAYHTLLHSRARKLQYYQDNITPNQQRIKEEKIKKDFKRWYKEKHGHKFN